MSVSLDGFVEDREPVARLGTHRRGLHTAFNGEAAAVSAFLYGRRMYGLMAGYWPTAESRAGATPAEIEFARIWVPKPKVVFSSTLAEVGWNSRLVRGDPVEEVRRLKAESGFDMGVGGPTLAAALVRAGLVDEFRLAVHPVILGAGRPFFPSLDDGIDLRLLETRRFGSGVVALRYETRR
jgi:dihydrofolate reductase